jgi:hypothetical protein
VTLQKQTISQFPSTYICSPGPGQTLFLWLRTGAALAREVKLAVRWHPDLHNMVPQLKSSFMSFNRRTQGWILLVAEWYFAVRKDRLVAGLSSYQETQCPSSTPSGLARCKTVISLDFLQPSSDQRTTFAIYQAACTQIPSFSHVNNVPEFVCYSAVPSNDRTAARFLCFKQTTLRTTPQSSGRGSDYEHLGSLMP